MPGYQPGAVAIATVIHCRDHALLKRARRQGAPKTNCQRLFSDPTATEFVDALRGGLVSFIEEKQHTFDKTAGFFHTGLLPVFGQAFGDCVFEAVLPVNHPLQDVSE
ncbi:hypothetical protein D3C72_1860800 [compost metagenome]